MLNLDPNEKHFFCIYELRPTSAQVVFHMYSSCLLPQLRQAYSILGGNKKMSSPADLVMRMLMNLGSVKSCGSTRSLIHLKMAPALGSAAIARPSSDWTRMSGNMKLRPRSSRISSMRSFFWSISAR